MPSANKEQTAGEGSDQIKLTGLEKDCEAAKNQIEAMVEKFVSFCPLCIGPVKFRYNTKK